ncbi:hypothetical protein FRC04_006326 [Tulasnella sp. 424]|nr:hypothetical protein FRC04_006326 [Tulasnella sp. 424]
MVRFETNWNNGQLRHPCYFLAPGGYMAELVPGGRWLLATVKRRRGTLLYHDLDSQVSERKARVLVDHNHEGWTIWTMDFAVDPTAARFEFDLALELATEGGAKLLPDGRIVSVFVDRVELHAPPKECWEEGPSIPQDMPRVLPQWVFEYKPSTNQPRSKVSRLMYYPKLNSVVFSFHNRGSLFTFRIVTDRDSLPEVTTVVNPVMEDRAFIRLGTSHAIRNTPGRKEAVLVTFPQSAQLPALHSFAGITNSQTSNAESQEPCSVTETLFEAPLPSGGGGWEMDEQSGRVLCTLRGRWDNSIALYEANGHDNYDPVILRIKRRRNSLLPVSRLHRELLHSVFQLALPNQRFGRSYRYHPFEYYDALFTIRQVSHSWDCEISTTPLFWTLTSSEFSSPFLDLVLERSQDAALDVVALSGQEGSDYWRSADAYWGEAVKAYLSRVMERGIREFHVRVPTGENLDPYIVDRLNPRMKVLSLYGEDQLTSTRPLQTPQLVDLHLVGCSLPWNHIHNLRCLSLKKASSPNLAQLVQVLHSSPMLQELKLSRIAPPPEDASNQAVVPADSIILPHLSTVTIHNTSLDLASGLLYRLFPSTTCRVFIDQGLDGEFDMSGFCQQAGRLCTPAGLVRQGIEPRLFILPHQLYLGMGPGRGVKFFKLDWSRKEKQSTTPGRAELARFFLEGGKGILSKVSISRLHLHVEPRSVVAEGLAIAHDFFPDIVELDITIEEGMDMFAVLAEPINGEGNSGWPLPKLSVLNIKAVWGESGPYDSVITMVEKRMHAAALSPSSLSAITTLRFAGGRVTSGSLESLDMLGIKYELNSVAVL